MCNKMYFESKLEAKRASKTKRGDNKFKPQFKTTPYKCDKCDGWHLTRYTKKIVRIVAKRMGQS